MIDDTAILKRLKSLRPRLDVSDEDLIELFWLAHPRFQFFKTLPWDSNLIDIGAGNGGLAHWKSWGKYIRLDLTLYGVDMDLGEHHGLYAGWEKIDLDTRAPQFPGISLDAFYTTHLIEHLRNPKALISWIGERAESNARIYIEWPNPSSTYLPTRERLLEAGIDVVISNFNDDHTHQATPSLATVESWLTESRLSLLASGVVDIGLLGEELFVRAKEAATRTMGYWSMTHWSHYVVAQKL